MYTQIIVLQICILLSIASLVFIGLQRPSDDQQALFKLSICAFIVIFGYILSYTAASEQMAAFAFRVMYAGCFYYYFALLFYSGICGFKLPKALRITVLVIVLIEFALSFSFDYHSLFFKSWEFIFTEDGYCRMHTVEGIGSVVSNVVGMLLAFLSVAIVHRKARSLSKTRKFQSRILGIVALLVPAAFILELVTKGGFYVPVAYTAGQIILAYLVRMTGLYDVDDVIRAEAFKGMDDAIIAFDADMKFRGANPLAASLFPGLKSISQKEKVTEKQFPVLSQLMRGEMPEYPHEGRIFEATVKDVEGSEDLKALWLRDVTEQRKNEDMMKNYQQKLEKEVEDQTRRIASMQNKIIRGLADIIENRDDNTGGHVKRTSYVVHILTSALLEDGYPGVSPEFGHMVAGSAPLHDLGKISIPDSVLQKPGKLSDEEFGIMKSHSARGADMVAKLLEGVEIPKVVDVSANIARSHHEKWDGSGYPEHLKNDEIPLEARIMAIADVYDALVSKRCYKDPMPFDKAYDIIDSGFGKQFDPSLKKYFDQCRSTIEGFYEEENSKPEE